MGYLATLKSSDANQGPSHRLLTGAASSPHNSFLSPPTIKIYSTQIPRQVLRDTSKLASDHLVSTFHLVSLPISFITKHYYTYFLRCTPLTIYYSESCLNTSASISLCFVSTEYQSPTDCCIRFLTRLLLFSLSNPFTFHESILTFIDDIKGCCSPPPPAPRRKKAPNL